MRHQTLNDFHYYGNEVDKYAPDIYELQYPIDSKLKYTVYCVDDNVTLIFE